MSILIITLCMTNAVLVAFVIFLVKSILRQNLAFYRKLSRVDAKVTKVLTEVLDIAPTVDDIYESVYNIEKYTEIETLQQIRNALISVCKIGNPKDIEDVSKAYDSLIKDASERFQVQIEESSEDIRKSIGITLSSKIN